MTTISVIIPLYNHDELLIDALESIRLQTFDDIEIIVVDDGSDSDYTEIIDEFGMAIKLVEHEQNKGAAAARNTGMDAARGEFFAFLDADDVWKPTKLEKQLDVFEKGEPDLGLVYTGFNQHELDGTNWKRYPKAQGNIYVEELERDRIHPTSTVMIRSDCIDQVGGFDPSLPSRQDYDLWIRISTKYTVSFVNEILVEKYEQADSISKNFESRIKGDQEVLKKVRERAAELGVLTRMRILSYHHHVLGRDYESNGDRLLAIKHILTAIVMYPLRPVSWAMLSIAILGINRDGRLLTYIKSFVR